MSRERTLNELDIQVEQEKAQHILSMLDMGWWEVNLKENTFSCSSFVANILAQNTTFDFSEFKKMIREDYRARIVDKILSVSEDYTDRLSFPVYVKEKTVWISIRFKKNGEYSIAGMMHTIQRSEGEKSGETSLETVKNLMYQLSGISKSLYTFTQSENLDDMVNHILASLVTHYSAERAYIFEYNWKDMNQSCTYEAVSRPGLEEIQNLQEVFFEPDTWWNQQILTQHPIILNTLDDLPEWDVVDRDFLAAQDIKSLMVVPFVKQDNTIWGYAGIDIVDKQRDWTEEDFQWFSSLMNIINICFELAKSKVQIQNDKDYLQKLLTHMPIGFIPSRIIYENDVPVDFVYTGSNKEIERITGLTTEQIVGVKGSESSFFRDLPLLVEVVNTDKHIEIDLPMPHVGKHCRAIKFSLQKDEVISLVLDVTETHNAHKALEEREKLLRTIYDNLPVGLELYSKEGILNHTNDKALEILGLEEASSPDSFNVFDIPFIPTDVKRKIKRGEKVDFNLHYDPNKLKPDLGEDLPHRALQNLTIKIVPIFGDQQEILNYLFIIINNTETTNAYLKIQEFEEYFSLIANLAKVGYFKLNLSTHEGFGLSQWYTNLGKSLDTVMADDLEDIYSNVHPDDFKVVKDFYAKAAAGEAENFEQEIRVLGENDKIKWLRCTLIAKREPTSDNIELIGVSYDITELKEMILAKDKAEALDRLKSAFLANMSHEIRTPLNSIIGFSDLLAETDDEDERKEFIAIIQRNNELLLKLVSDILDLSKIESGTFDFVRKEINTKTISEEVMQTFRNRELPEGVELIFDDSQPEEIMYADPGRVKQVLMNFITNSLKFTQKGHVKLGYKSLPEDHILFYVEDTGVGISPENIDKIFDRFVKLDSFAQGTGLGLSICKSLIEEMEGEIGVDSEAGKGSRFWFTLPRSMDKILAED
ncbi:PAS domain-containing protein [Parabacteroides sp. OttesenSCG-928-G07]|nr:PAS domain-containing protein [Parabacteroides sp. OttesenSCG-928-G21]MDL2278718.1 PAS domain-containing protein [Parabacteroides sp. OttesenSCG-928-G07]